MIIAGFDQGAKRTGWCVGEGSRTPKVGAWRFDDIGGAEIGKLGFVYERRLITLHEQTGFEVAVYEAPLLDRRRDKLMTLRRRLGLDMILETFCEARGIIIEEAPYGQLKRELAGRPTADKDDMIAAALKMGVALPKTDADGREDAADGSAAWLIGVRCYAKEHLTMWHHRLYSARGALL